MVSDHISAGHSNNKALGYKLDLSIVITIGTSAIVPYMQESLIQRLSIIVMHYCWMRRGVVNKGVSFYSEGL